MAMHRLLFNNPNAITLLAIDIEELEALLQPLLRFSTAS